MVMGKTLLAGVALFLVAQAPAEDLDAKEIVRRSDDLLRGGKSYTKLTMTITRPEWSRELTMEAWTEGAEKSFIRILSPAKEKGVTFLKKGREAWQYLPTVDRTIKIPPSMMLQSWMGSDFTNDDVVRADSIVVNYTHRIVDEPVEDGVAYWVIEAIPKPGAPVVWGKVVLKIRKEGLVAARADYYDEDGKLIRYYKTFDIEEIEGRLVPTGSTMYSAVKKGRSTTIKYRDLTFKPDISPQTFSLQNLKR